MRGTPRINWSLYHAFYDGKPALFPTDRDQLLQWLYSLDENGLQIKDNLALVALPETSGVNCLGFDSTQLVLHDSNAGVTDYPFTIAGWFNTSSLATQYMVCLGNSAGQPIFQAVYTAGGRVSAISAFSAQSIAETPEAYNDGEWHYFQGRFISDNLREIWVGDSPSSIGLKDSNSGVTDFTSFPNQISLGARYLGTTASLPYAGLLSECSFGVLENNLRSLGVSALNESEVLVMLGDSNTADDAHTTVATYKYAEYMSDNTPAGLTVTNSGQGGWQTTDILANLSTKLDPFYDVGKICSCTIMAGVNDLAASVGNKTVEQTITDYKALLDAVILRGWNVTIIAYYGWPTLNDDLETLNDAMEAYCVGKCAFFDPTSLLNASGTNSLNAIYNDATWPNHLNDLGGQALGSFITYEVTGQHLLYPNQEGYGLPHDVSGNGNHATSNTATWTTADGIPTANGLYGYTAEIVVTSTGIEVPPLANEIPIALGKYWNTVTKVTREDPLWSTDYHPAVSDESGAVKTLAVATFDGVTDYGTLDVAVNLAQDFDFECDIIIDPSADVTGENILAQTDGGGIRVVSGMLAYTRPGVGNTNLSPVPLVLGIDLNIIISRVGTTITSLINGVETSATVAQDMVMADRVFGSTTASRCLGGSVYRMEVEGSFRYDVTPALGKTTSAVTDLSGNGNDLTISTTDLDAFWAKRYADETGTYVDAVNYLPLAVAGSILEPNLHNGWEGSNLQTDANFAIFGGATVYGDGATLWTPLSYEDLLSVQPYDRNNVIRWKKDTIGTSGQCLVIDEIQYPTSYVFTLAGYNQTERWRLQYNKDESCGATALPFDFSFDFSNEDNSANIASIT